VTAAGAGGAVDARNERASEVVALAAERKRRGGGSGDRGSRAERHRVLVEKGRVGEVADAAEAGMLAAGGFNLYARGETLMRLATGSSSKVPGIRRDALAPVFTMATGPMMKEIFEASCEFRREGSKGEITIACPADVPGVYLSRVNAWRVPTARGVSEVPLVARNGSMICTGYDAEHGVVVCAGDGWPKVPAAPTREQALAALELFWNLLGGFPFVHDSDFAAALAALLSAVLRPTLPACPAFGFTAPVRGSGKSKLADVAAVLATGRPGAAITWSPKEEENTKLLGAAVMAGDAVVLIDNIEIAVRSAALNSMISQATVAVRVLGLSKLVRVETAALYLLTGNNLLIQGDLTRRVVVCNLDPETERPELRAFGFDPVQRARQERKQLVAALLTIAQWGLQVSDGLVPIGSFEEWSRRVRNTVMGLGLPDPCASMEALHKDDPEREAAVELLLEWRREFAGAPTTVSEAVRRATTGSTSLRDALDAVAGGPGGIRAKSLGRYLGRLKDRWIGDLVLRRSGDSLAANAAAWSVEKRQLS
jgi:putative DNA primase/helicase